MVFACKGLQAQQRITGGFPINITDAPWQVLLSFDNDYGCGGSIIAPNYILTARHCVRWKSPNSVKVIAGVTCEDEIDDSNTFDVSNIILYPDPNVDTALLQLSSNITYNNSRQPVNYWSSADNSLYNAGNTARVSGWGWLTPNGYDPADCLQAVNLFIITNQQASNMLCVNLAAHEVATKGNGTEQQGHCHGDSGGPLTTIINSNERALIGVVSWSNPDCWGNYKNLTSVYVRVSHVINWIESFTCITNFRDKIVTTNTTVTSCGDINIQYVKVQNGAKLTLDAAGEVNIISDFEVDLGSEFEIK